MAVPTKEEAVKDSEATTPICKEAKKEVKHDVPTYPQVFPEPMSLLYQLKQKSRKQTTFFEVFPTGTFEMKP